MTHRTHVPPASDGSMRPFWFLIGVMVAFGLPGVLVVVSGTHPAPIIGAIVFGIAILSAAFLLSWSAETAELDISQGLALAIIAIIAVLPEYAVDLVLAWEAGGDPTSKAATERSSSGCATASTTPRASRRRPRP